MSDDDNFDGYFLNDLDARVPAAEAAADDASDDSGFSSEYNNEFDVIFWKFAEDDDDFGKYTGQSGFDAPLLTAADRLEAADPKAEAEEAAQATLPQNRFAKSFKQFGRSVGEERRTMDADNEEPILRQGALDKDPILRRGALHTDPTLRP